MARVYLSNYFCVQNVKVLNSPARVYSVSNPAALTMSKLTIDDCTSFYTYFAVNIHSCIVAAGDAANSKSDGKAAGHNTDGFDCSTTNLVIEDRSVATMRRLLS